MKIILKSNCISKQKNWCNSRFNSWSEANRLIPSWHGYWSWARSNSWFYLLPRSLSWNSSIWK